MQTMIQFITQAAIEAIKTETVRAMAEAADLAEYSTGWNVVVSGPNAGRPQFRNQHLTGQHKRYMTWNIEYGRWENIFMKKITI